MKLRLRDGTGIELKYLVEDVDRHGNRRVYVRRQGRKVRIRAVDNLEDFTAAYRAAVGKLPDTGEYQPSDPAAPGSLRWLCQRYYRSAEYRRLADSTRTVRRGILDGLCAGRGALPYARMERRHVRELRDEKADRPEAANARVKALRRVFAWAIEDEVADRNPAAEVPYISTGSEGFHTWTVDEIRHFEARHPIGSKARLALGLMLYTGARRSDVVKLGPQMERDGYLCFTETKGRAHKIKEREIRILPELRASIDATPSGHLNYLVTAFNKPFTVKGFGGWFRRRCDEAGLHGCSAHGLRKAGATIAAENGATEYELMAMYEWESPKQAAIYTRKANRKRLAAEAMHKLVPSVPPANPGVSHRGAKS